MVNEPTFKHISANQVQQQLSQTNVVIVDIRDANAFATSHITGAIHLTNETLGDFIREADLDAPTIVCCYHGISSQQAANFLISQDFSDVYSLDGGFEQWAMLFPNDVDTSH